MEKVVLKANKRSVTGKQVGQLGAGGSFTVTLTSDIAAHMFYVGRKYAAAVAQPHEGQK